MKAAIMGREAIKVSNFAMIPLLRVPINSNATSHGKRFMKNCQEEV
jgi:hypothetical protein